MEEKMCFFIGHRDTPQDVFSALEQAVERQIAQYGVTEFVVGHYGNFDAMAAQAVQRAKQRHPMVTLTLLLPYHPAERQISLPQGFDNSFYPPGMETTPRRVAIVRANRYMADHCDCLIACVRHPGNARELLEYAKKKENIHVENLV